MPGTTPTYALPYQVLTDPPNGATLGSDLANAVEDELERIDAAATALDTRVDSLEGEPTIQHGTVNVTVTASTQGTATVVFPVAYGAAPTVTVSTENPNYEGFARFRTPTQVEVGVRHLDATSTTTNVVLCWIAAGT